MPYDKMKDRRSVLKSSAACITSLGFIGNAAATNETKEENDSRNTDHGNNPDGDVEPQYISQASTEFSPFSIDPGEEAELTSTWTIAGSDFYQLDVLIESEYISKPETVTNNVGAPNKDWEYRSNSPIGPAYHWQFSGWIILKSEVSITALVDTHSSGTTTANTGTFWPLQSWTSGTLHHD